MFRLLGVRKAFGDTMALESVSFDIGPGEVVAFVGPSGSGKTTLLNLMAAVLAPDAGEVRIKGTPAGALRQGRALAALVGVMPQQFDLVPALPVVHNVLAGRLRSWGLLRSLFSLVVPQDLDRAQDALRRVGIPDKLYIRTEHLSGGEQQRVALARLLLQAPEALLADEPVASLDPARAHDVIGLLTGLARQQGQTLVVSLHSVDLARRYFDRIIGLRKGKIAFDRPADRLGEPALRRLYAIEEGTG